MGLDGGTIISRSDVLRGASWRIASSDAQQRSSRGGQVSDSYVAQQQAANAADVAAAKWSSCALTGEPLREPLVADDLGKLYNKESVVQLLLAKSGVFPDDAARYRYENQLHFMSEFEHLRSLKHVFLLHQSRETPAPCQRSNFSAAASSSSSSTPGQPPSTRKGGPQGESKRAATIGSWVCPITALQVGGSHQFAALRPCGHCFSSRALREVSGASCPLCGTPYGPLDVVGLNPPEKQMQERREQLRNRQEEPSTNKGKRKTRKDKQQGSPPHGREDTKRERRG